MNKKIILNLSIYLFFVISHIPVHSSTVYTGVHQTEFEIGLSDYNSTYGTTFVPAKGKFTYYNNDLKFDGDLKYRLAASTNSEYDGDMNYSAFGGRWQYNGIKDVTLGIKGALDYDYIFLSKENYYTRLEQEEYQPYSSNIQSEESFGIKFYGNKYYHPYPKITTGFWNEFTVTKIEENDYQKNNFYQEGSLESDTDSTYLTVSPRILYVDEWSAIKFVGEAYVDIRKYFKGSVDLNGTEKDYFYKIIVNPQFIYNKSGKNSTSYIYANVENEKMMTIDFWQHIFKIAPKYEYKGFDRFTLGAAGAGYEKQEEIGINFDNKELFALKLSDSYSSSIFALRLYIEYQLNEKWSVGNENIIRNGEWNNKDGASYLNEIHNISYLKYTHKFSGKSNIEIKNSYEIYRNENDLNADFAPIEENMFRIKATWNYYL